jgi:hypothetical protein
VYDPVNGQWAEFAGGRIEGDNAWAVRQTQAANANATLVVQTHPLVVPPVDLAHICGLEWDLATQQIKGGHLRSSVPSAFPIGSITYTVNIVAATPSGTAPYSANIQLETGGRVFKQKTSDMFPDSWSEATVEAAIEDAYRNAYSLNVQRNPQRGVMGGMFVGQGNGLWVVGYLSPGGRQIASARPLL